MLTSSQWMQAGRVAALVLWFLAGMLAVWYGWRWLGPDPGQLPVSKPRDIPGQDASVRFDARSWEVFQRTDRTEEPQDPAANRYRLAGTFFIQSEDANVIPQRSAILDDLGEQRQYLVREGDRVATLEIIRIYADRLIARSQGRDIEIRLGFTEPIARATATTEASDERFTQHGERILSETKFGQQIAETRWVMSRDALMGYYRAVLDQPERVASLYMSMKGVRDEEGEPDGFRLEPVGEREFFEAVGLREGDVIRAVNSMRMTSQPRAEYFLSEFVHERLNAVVIDVDRAGELTQLIYLLR
ncbi:MAG TPA: hypothetical protein PKE55_00595 [Kiritimatiellia bacterium]|nr:hypothetical protein [Kiritimatiellia bacterium]